MKNATLESNKIVTKSESYVYAILEGGNELHFIDDKTKSVTDEFRAQYPTITIKKVEVIRVSKKVN